MFYWGFGKVCKFFICLSYEYFEFNREKVLNNRRMLKYNIVMVYKESFDEEVL